MRTYRHMLGFRAHTHTHSTPTQVSEHKRIRNHCAHTKTHGAERETHRRQVHIHTVYTNAILHVQRDIKAGRHIAGSPTLARDFTLGRCCV